MLNYLIALIIFFPLLKLLYGVILFCSYVYYYIFSGYSSLTLSVKAQLSAVYQHNSLIKLLFIIINICEIQPNFYENIFICVKYLLLYK